MLKVFREECLKGRYQWWMERGKFNTIFMILRRLFWDLEKGTRAGLQPRANAGQTAPLGPSLRGLHWAGTAPSTCVRHSGSKETTHMAVWDVLGLPVSLSSVLLWCGQLVQAYPALMPPPMGFCSSLIPGHCACPAGGQGGFGNLIGRWVTYSVVSCFCFFSICS